MSSSGHPSGEKEVKARVEYIKLPMSRNKAHKKSAKSRSSRKYWSMDIITFKLPPELNSKLEKVAAYEKKIAKSKLIRMAIIKYLEDIQ